MQSAKYNFKKKTSFERLSQSKHLRISLVVYFMIFIEKLYPFMVHPLTVSSQVVS